MIYWLTLNDNLHVKILFTPSNWMNRKCWLCMPSKVIFRKKTLFLSCGFRFWIPENERVFFFIFLVEKRETSNSYEKIWLSILVQEQWVTVYDINMESSIWIIKG